jgi:hypothetical protein
MALQPITRKTVTEDGEQITTYQKMCDALDFAKTKGYYGGITLSPTGVYQLQLTHPSKQQPQFANLNDVFVVQDKASAGAIITLVPLAQYNVIYNMPA